MTITLRGSVLNDAGAPLNGATVQLTASLGVLGADPQAAVLYPGGVTWTRSLSGFAGSTWNCWQKHVAQHVAGITWEAFRRDVLDYNPTLRRTGERFEAGQGYVLPENRFFADTRDIAPTIAWDRELTGFGGSLWDAWQRFVQLKVVGLTWPEFREGVRSANPDLAGSGDTFHPGRRYLLPHNPGLADYHRLAACDSQGSFIFTDLPAGRYRLDVRADGYHRLRRTVDVTGDTILDLRLEPIMIFDDRADPFVRTAGRELVFNGRALRFVGVNLRGLVHYGDKSTLPDTEDRSQEEQLRSAYEMGARVVRVFLPSEHATTEQTIDRLERLLGKMRTGFPDMFLIVCLTNLYDDTKFYLRADREYYTTPWEKGKLLQPEWFSEGYKRHYLPFVGAVVTRFSQERQILAWEPGNELKVNDNPELLVQFMHATATTIRRLDTNHLITTGMVSTRHAYMKSRGDLQRKLYDHPLIDFITVHAYNGKNKEDDSGLSMACNKPFIVEEAAFDSVGGDDPDEPGLHPCQNRDRSPCVQADMDKWFGRGASGYMQWAFMAGGDNGDGDFSCGIGPRFHGYDWELLRGTYQARFEALQQAAPEIAQHRPLTPVGQPGRVQSPAAPLRLDAPLVTAAVVRVRRTPGDQNKLASDIIGKAAPGTPVQRLGPHVHADNLDWSMVSVMLDSGQTVQGWMAHAKDDQALLVNAA